MNQQDTTMMIAAQIAAALTAQYIARGDEHTDEDRLPILVDGDMVPDAKGLYVKNENGYWYRATNNTPEDKRYSVFNTPEHRIANYAARMADLTVHAVQFRLNIPG
jgi:hypothetical protein